KLNLEGGASVTTTDALSNTGTVSVDATSKVTIGSASGTADTVTVARTLTDSGVFTAAGNFDVTSTGTLSVGAKGDVTIGGTLTNAGTITLAGTSSGQALLDVRGAAGFGTTGIETGTVDLENDALLEFKNGPISTIDGELFLSGVKARVADVATPGSNSALTGLTTVAGNFFLQNGATVGLTGNVAITGSGWVSLDRGSGGGNIGGAGGSSLTVSGNLTDSSTNGLDIGNTGLTTTDTVTVKGTGGLTNGINSQIIIQGGTAAANLTVAHSVTTSGTLVVGSSGSASVLTTPNVDVTGGNIDGFGTVIGALNNNGGGNVSGGSGGTGTLTVQGAYNQSGTGVLQSVINTNDRQPSSIVDVTGGPAKPGTPGSINLSGGTLLINGQSTLALDTPYTMLTFAGNALYGQFAKVETEGTLGTNTGNSTSVNLGKGDTLDVIYDESAGQVQVELVKTPAATAYSWDVGSGTWNASSAADWNPPKNGTVPRSNSNVTIGTGAGGTVSLGLDQTVNSLAVTNKYTLNGNGHSITTNANASVAVDGALSINDLNIGGTFAINGSATINGVLTSVGTVTTDAGGKLALSNGTINDSIIAGKGTFETNAGTNGTLRNVTISSGTIYSAIDKATTHLSGTAITNNGTIHLNGGGGANGLLVLDNSLTLKGTGALVMSTATGGGDAILQGNGETLTNASTIEGTGLIGNGSLALINEGTIDANSTAGVGGLTLNGSGGITNTGTLKSNGGDLTVQGAVTGSGADQIAAGGTMVFGSSVSSEQTINFANIGDTLTLDHAESFSGTVAGLAAASTTSFDAIDLADFNFADTKITDVTGTGAKGTTTNVTLTDSKDHLTTTLHLLNQYASQFAVNSNAYSLTSDNSSKPGTIFCVDHTLGVPNHGIGHG
ncbi:MAG TPA: hypothetical protein VME69_02365, partial [Methylocella sp.]|nr:hypothetical protein [Methylocella sp.]